MGSFLSECFNYFTLFITLLQSRHKSSRPLLGENPYLPVFPSQLSFNELEAPLKQFLQERYPQTPEPRFDPIAITLKNLKIFKNTRLSKVKPEQDTMLLNQLKKVVNLKGHLSQLCEYIQLKDGRGVLCQKIDSISQSESPPLYELLARIKEPLTIISTEYTTLLEETFKKYQKPFVTLSIATILLFVPIFTHFPSITQRYSGFYTQHLLDKI